MGSDKQSDCKDDTPSGTHTDESDDRESGTRVAPVKEKIGESRDNLRRREEWHRRRSGDAS